MTTPSTRRAIALALSVLGTACTHRDPMAAAVAERQLDYQMPLNTAVFLDEGLARTVSVESSGATRNESNTMRVSATLRNRTDAAMKVSARTQFFGANKQLIESTGWTHLFLDRRALGSYETSATRPAAAFYHIEISYGR